VWLLRASANSAAAKTKRAADLAPLCDEPRCHNSRISTKILPLRFQGLLRVISYGHPEKSIVRPQAPRSSFGVANSKKLAHCDLLKLAAPRPADARECTSRRMHAHFPKCRHRPDLAAWSGDLCEEPVTFRGSP
jgi:hypothetical protein